ncbi:MULTISPECIES: efflux RND transporter periplasmic adaptor subunit [Caulobacter]|jgi:RND family efflux transporter MFP subunit|uniref:RND family efflux transporter, MFP subunit n=1 Tax=Caulobacter vibrioides OR37 TaxID=1292034 RepID=R0EBT0_CAUVI|nr:MULTISPECIES: efflux RND transporter periplasmic adaptor subunit [Caulobacter]ENZ82938.1 RND family efflux transporter, MFP subunit [Caulobacter vibrioides OR37]MBQ1559703.1 efflux RND transporter periplasmic adaptor subunit [Caulobacter sp.]
MPETASVSTPKPSRRLKLIGAGAACVAVAVVAVGVVTRVQADQSLKAWNRAQAIPTVGLAPVKGGGARDLVLPGQLQAFYNAPIHARVSGYLKRWYVDLGAPVKAGQLLAEIDTPDLDQQVLQARANLATAQANQRLSSITAKRWEGLVAQDAVSRQEADEKMGDLAARNSAVNAARADLDRLLAQQSFKRITAPFDGVVTARNTDIGQLISVGGAADTALFTVADQKKLRVYVSVPQNNSALIHRGLTAALSLPEYPGQTFKAVVVNDAQAVAANGAMLVELQLDNPDGKLKPGGYAQVAFKLPSAPTATTLPATALMYLHDTPAVAVVGPDSHVHLRPVKIQRDLGAEIEIGAGVQAGDKVVNNPPESLADGDLVRVTSAPAKGGAANAKG